MRGKFNRFYIDVLNSLKSYSTCSRLHVAAILVKDSRILSSGYNGVANRCKECNKIFTKNEDGTYQYVEYEPRSPTLKIHNLTYEQYREIHHEFADRFEIHAEMNCIGYALRNNTDITGAQLFVTTSPCLNCCKLILTSGIKEVYYMEAYDDLSGIKYLTQNGVICDKIDL